jgi:hypothetical protein
MLKMRNVIVFIKCQNLYIMKDNILLDNFNIVFVYLIKYIILVIYIFTRILLELKYLTIITILYLKYNI